MKASSLAWCRLNSVPVIRAARSSITRQFIAQRVQFAGRLKSLDDLELSVLHELNQSLSRESNDKIEIEFLDFLRGKI
jgi:hypothetical protein